MRILVIATLFVLFFRNAEFGKFLEYFTWKMLVSILMVQPLMLVSNGIVAYRFSFLVSLPRTPFIPTFKAVILAIGLNNIFPAHMSQFFKIAYLRKHAETPTANVIGGIFIERFVDLLILATVALLTLAFMSVDNVNSVLLFAVISASLILIIALPYSRKPLTKMASFVPWSAFQNLILDLTDHLINRTRGWGFYLAVFYGIAAIFFSFTGVYIVIMKMGSIPVRFQDLVKLYVATTIFGSALPSLPGGFGVYEATAAAMLNRIGYDVNEAIALGFALHLSQILLSFVLSLVFFVTEKVGVQEILDDLKASR